MGTPLQRLSLAIACAAVLGCGDGPPGSSSASASAAAPLTPLASTSPVEALAAPTASAARVDPALSARGIRWGISCTPARLTMATRDQLVLEISAHNESNQTLDAKRHETQFSSDGGGRLGFAFGNGHFDKRWTALPPGETVTNTRMMGESVLPRPGDFHIAVMNDGAKATCTIHVDP